MPPRPAREARQPGFTPGKEAWRINIERQLSRFCESSELTLAFPPTLSSEERRFVHAHAPKLGLATKSQGKGDERFLTVKKPQHVVALDGDAPVATLAPGSAAALAAHFAAYPAQPAERDAARRGHVADAQASPEPGSAAALGGVRNARNRARAAAAKAPAPPPKIPPAMLAARMKLPAWEYRDRVAALVAAHDVVLVAGETGCGKSTQVPQFVLDGDPDARIACSQPRRISAMAVAERVASERGSQLGREVGFHVRFESSFSDATRLCFATPGVLLRKLGSDPDLVAYTHFILDEVHEEDRDTEFLLVALRELVARRANHDTLPRLRLVLMSATLAADKLTEYFGGCPRISIGGSNFPVSTFFLEDVLKQTKYVTLPKEAPRADAFDGLDADAKAKVVAAGKALDLGLRCALCGKSTFQSPEELGDHMAECLGEMEEPASPGGGDDDAAVLADVIYHREDEFELGVGSLNLCPISRDDDDPRSTPAAFAASQASSADGEGDALVRVYQRRVAEQTLDELLVCALLNYVVRSSYERGAVLVFVAGWADIESIATAIEADDDLKHLLWVVPLHGSIESSKQKDAFKAPPADRWKVVIATNVAETSITIPDVSFVIDGGLEKTVKFDDHLGASVLRSNYVSQASARQRKGRAGRTRPGVCFRLYTKRRHDHMEPQRLSELLRANLEGLCLHATALRITPRAGSAQAWTARDFLGRALNAPREKSVDVAVQSLIALGALFSDDESVTPLGAALATQPLAPRLALAAAYARLLCQASAPQAFRMLCTLDAKDPFVAAAGGDGRSRSRREFGGDSLSDVKALRGAAEGFRDAQQRGTSAAYGYCRSKSLSYATLSIVVNAARQLDRDVPRCDPASDHGVMDEAFDALACLALYPNVAARLPGESQYGTRCGAKCRVHNASLAGDRESPFSTKARNDADQPQLLCFAALLESDAQFRTGLKLATAQPCATLALVLLCHSDVRRNDATVCVDGWLRYAVDPAALDGVLALRLRLRRALLLTVRRARLPPLLLDAVKCAAAVLGCEQRALVRPHAPQPAPGARAAPRGKGRGRGDGKGKGDGRGKGREARGGGDGRGKGRGDARGKGGRASKADGKGAKAKKPKAPPPPPKADKPPKPPKAPAVETASDYA